MCEYVPARIKFKCPSYFTKFVKSKWPPETQIFQMKPRETDLWIIVKLLIKGING